MSKEIGIIYARLIDDTIGINGRLPWFNLEHDMKNFIKVTQNNIVIMGKNTFASIAYKPLPNRINIVVSKSLYEETLKKRNIDSNDIDEISYTQNISSVFNISYHKNKHPFTKTNTEIIIVRTFEDARLLSDEYDDRNVYYIGGINIFKSGYEYCNAIYETVVNNTISSCSNNDRITSFNVHNITTSFDDIWKTKLETVIEPKIGPSYTITKYTTDIVNVANKIPSVQSE